jgi:hypothetical protein
MDDERRERGDVMFHASEVAAVLGRNAYEKRWMALCKIWRRHSRDSFARAGIELPDDRVESLSKSDDAVRRLVEEAASVAPSDVESIVARATKIAERAGASAKDAKALAERARKESFCAHGIAEEAKAISELEDEVVVDQKFIKRELATLADGTLVLVGGRLDASAPSRVVEIKNRVSGLRFGVPAHELPQLYVYMFAKGARASTLVERVALADGTAMTCRHDVEWRDDAWRDIADGLTLAAKTVRSLATNEETARAFAASRTKDAFLSKLCT